MHKIVISGATGMIGSTLAEIALKKNIEVLCIARKNSNRHDNLPKINKLKIVHANLSEYNNLKDLGTYDVFYHLAWDKTYGVSRDDVDAQVLNIQYTLDTVRLAYRLGCKKFIGAGSQAEYGIVNEPLKPQTPVNPQNGYGISKYAAGKLSKLLCEQLNMEFNWVRILSVYGPLDSAHTLIMYIINELKSGRSPELTKCKQIWDYLYCDDCARALLAIGEKGVNRKTYPLGSGEERKLSEYIEIIRDLIAPDVNLQYGKKDYYPHQPMYLCADISELTTDTGWKPKVEFEEGIKRILEAS